MISNLFYFFLSAPILSPFVFGVTLYIYCFIIFFDLSFLTWVCKTYTNKLVVVWLGIFFLALLVTFDLVLIIKLLMLFFSCLYVLYTYQCDKFKLYRYVVLNVAIGLAQFIFVFVNPSISLIIGPENISKVVWGSLAGPAFTNFYAISLLPRVSGLSREGGFFASFIIVSFFIYLFDHKIKKTFFYNVVFGLGILISLSKVSVAVFLVGLVLFARRVLNKFGLIASLAGVLGSLSLFSLFLLNYTQIFFDTENETLIHRLSGYSLFFYLDLKDLIFGTSLHEAMHNFGPVMYSVSSAFIQKGYEFCGFPSIYAGHGILFFLVFVISLFVLKFKGVGIALLIMLTINVDPVTNTGFVVLAWYFSFYVSNYQVMGKQRVFNT